MKRSHSSEDWQDQDDSSLDSHLLLDDYENELCTNPKSDVVKSSGPKDPPLVFPTKELDVVIEKSAANDNKDILKNASILSEKDSNNSEKLCDKREELLLEAISSDDDMAMDNEEGELDSDVDEIINDYTDEVEKTFVPSLFQATPLRIIQDPSLSFSEYNHRKLGDISKCEEVSELIDCLEYLQSKNMDINEKWIDMAERTILILPKTLCHILNNSEYCHKLFSLVNVTLDFNCAFKEHASMSTLIIRHLKIGLNLVEALCHYNEDLSEHLIKHHQIHNKLIDLFFVEHMSLSFKLNILRALDASLNGSEPIRLFLYSGVLNDLNGYQTLLKILSIHQRPRVCFLVTSILRKIHFYELLQKLNGDINLLDSNSESVLEECLAEITTTYIKAPILMGCPKRFLQARAQFELTPALIYFDVYPTIYRLFDDLSLINCIKQLLIKPNIISSLVKNLLKLLQSIMNCDHGLRYLGCRHKEFNEMIKVLNKVDPKFKLSIIYKVKVLSLIDYLGYFWECNLMHNFKLDQMESVDILHDMLLLTQSTVGKYSVVNVLTMGDNLDVIFNFFKYMEQSKSKYDELHMLYAMDLMTIVLENSEDVSYLKKYGSVIYEIACKHNCFNDLIAWTFPAMKRSAFFHDDVSEMCNILKNNIDNCLNFNKTLITCLRILKYLGVPNYEMAFEGVEDFVELKYKYIILQMYSCDVLGNLLTIVDTICDNYKQPSVNVCKLTGKKAKNIIYILHPTMVLIRYMITLLIQSRGNMFKDLLPIKVLLKLYNLIHYVPDCSTIKEDAIKVEKDIVKTLEAYIEIKIGSLMINEVIVWTLSCPSVFLPGLLLLCKLLPATLPIQTMKPLEESVISTIVSNREKWIEHLAEVNDNLVELITVLGSSSLLIQTMKCLCNQIADLCLSTCLLVSQTLLDSLINTNNNVCFNRYLDLLRQLCDNNERATIKTTVLQILNEQQSQKNYEQFVQRLCENISVNEQENSILFVQCLCDSDIGLSDSCSEERLFPLSNNSLPNKLFLNNILKAVFNLFESNKHLSTLSLFIKTCLVIIKNDYGFYHFKIILDSFPKFFYNIFKNILQKWNKEDAQCYDALMLTLELINLCTKNNTKTKRLLFMNVSQLRECLNWSDDVHDHPICLLQEIIQKEHPDYYKNIVNLLEMLNDDQNLIVDLTEPQLSTDDFLASMFKDRVFYVVVNNNDESSTNSIVNLSIREFDILEECNIEEVFSDLTDFNIKDKINDLFKIENCIAQPPKPIVHKQKELIVTEKNEKVNAISSPIIPTMPIRHKVFSRLGTIQRTDAFRNRLPNTSRPPSLHVDDFVARETRNARQQPRYKLPIQPIQDLNIRLRERQMAYERTYSLLNPFKPQLSLHSWHAQVNALAHLRADYHQKINSRHLELQRHSLVAEWNQLRVQAVLRKNRAYSRR